VVAKALEWTRDFRICAELEHADAIEERDQQVAKEKGAD